MCTKCNNKVVCTTSDAGLRDIFKQAYDTGRTADSHEEVPNAIKLQT